MNEIETKTFYLTAFLLNYDITNIFVDNKTIQTKSYVSEKILELILSNTNYPEELLVNKFFEFVKWFGLDLNELVSIIINKTEPNPTSILTEEADAIKENIQKYFNFLNFKNIDFKKFSHQEVHNTYIYLIQKKIISLTNDIKHSGQPLPDPVLGRPKLSWCRCTHKDCNKKFGTASQLTMHLTENNVYTKGYHLIHEEAIRQMGLTIEKVNQNNITKCPSWLCEIKDFNSPTELIKHLQLLGIKPFWYEGLEINDNSNILNLFDKKNKIYHTSHCLMCLGDSPNIMINRCGHQVYCVNCVGELSKMSESIKTNCPVCRGKIDKFYPYA